MQLYITPTSPYARVVGIVILEKGLAERVEIIVAETRRAESPYYRINPSGRVPYLVADDGVGLEDSALIAAYLDHLDGELARAKQKESLVGYYYDWFTDTFSYSILFISLAIGFHDMFSDMLNILVIFAVSACLFNTALSLLGEHHDNKELYKGFPSYAGFSIDDGMYMIGPICWMGYLYPFFIICLVGAVVYVVFTLVRFSVLFLKESRIDCNQTIDN